MWRCEVRHRLGALISALILLAAVACDRGTDKAPITSIDLGAGALTAAELAQFAPLPARMLDGASVPTDAQVDLGRMLFYETLLSGSHNVSCNSCHALNGFGADGRPRSFGDHGQAGDRNAPSVYNAAGQVAQFWDGRAATVEEQAKGPVLNPAEMGMPSPDAVLDHLRESATYRKLFRAAFPDEATPITYDNVGRAIGAFERGLVTPSRWDAFLAGDSGVLTAEERRGAKVFIKAGCASCHNGAYVGGGTFTKAGVNSPWPMQADSGRYRVTKKPGDMFVFKVPSLRNVAMTGPYFSDGSIVTLENAVHLMGRHQLGRDLSEADVASVSSYLAALTGTIPVTYIASPRLPEP
jgi:cytochrome c peroxidase